MKENINYAIIIRVIIMHVVTAIDSFKGSLTSLQAGTAVKEAILKVNADSEVTIIPLADGGEGTVEALSYCLSGEIIEIYVTGPIGEPVKAKYFLLENKTAIIEMAEASGITLIPEEKRNPLYTTTYGVGEIIKDAISRGSRDFIVGIGGSATNDGGTGMLSALGFEFTDKKGNNIPFGAIGLSGLSEISTKNVIPELKNCKFRIACDVTNPLCGENGCSKIFGPQKGATPEMIENMDLWLENYAELCKSVSDNVQPDFQGAGAAGGLGFAFLTFTDAILESGFKIVSDVTKLEEHIKNADIVVTGEGKLDKQTVMGKAPIGVAKLAKKYNKKVIAFSGVISDDAEICNEYGIDAYFPILRKITTTENAMKTDFAYRNLSDTAYQVFRLLK